MTSPALSRRPSLRCQRSFAILRAHTPMKPRKKEERVDCLSPFHDESTAPLHGGFWVTPQERLKRDPEESRSSSGRNPGIRGINNDDRSSLQPTPPPTPFA